MRRVIHIIGILAVFFLILIFIAQILLSSRIKREAQERFSDFGIESSPFTCTVDILKRKLTVDGLELRMGDNNFKVSRVEIFFSIYSLLTERTIRLIKFNEANLTVSGLSPFALTSAKVQHAESDRAKEPYFLIEELKIRNLRVKMRLSDSTEIPDMTVNGVVKNIGMNTKMNYEIEAKFDSSSVKVKGDLKLPNWKEHLTYNLHGRALQAGFFSLLEKESFPFTLNNDGRLDVTALGEVREGIVDSTLKIFLSGVSFKEKGDFFIEAFIQKIKSMKDLEIVLKIDGMLTNPRLRYDIIFEPQDIELE